MSGKTRVSTGIRISKKEKEKEKKEDSQVIFLGGDTKTRHFRVGIHEVFITTFILMSPGRNDLLSESSLENFAVPIHPVVSLKALSFFGFHRGDGVPGTTLHASS